MIVVGNVLSNTAYIFQQLMYHEWVFNDECYEDDGPYYAINRNIEGTGPAYYALERLIGANFNMKVGRVN